MERQRLHMSQVKGSGSWVRSLPSSSREARANKPPELFKVLEVRASLLILSPYLIICVVAAALYVAVNKLEPNRRTDLFPT
jgi:hypothetical protein